MSIYNGGNSYEVQGYDNVYIGKDLVWTAKDFIGVVNNPTHIIPAEKNEVTYVFGDVKAGLKNITTGLKINWHKNIPIGVTGISEERYEHFDDLNVTTEQANAYVHLSDYALAGGLSQQTIISKEDATAGDFVKVLFKKSTTGVDMWTIVNGKETSTGFFKSYPATDNFHLVFGGTSNGRLQITVQPWLDYHGMDKVGSKEFRAQPLIDSVEFY